jgi:uncharacterized YccA/Bax inhibitor family protein
MVATAAAPLSSGNPALHRLGPDELRTEPATLRTMSIGGTAFKTFVMLVVLVIGGAWGWSVAVQPVAGDIGGGYGNATVTLPAGLWLASFAAFGLGIAIAMRPTRAPALGPLYALLEGYVLGVISAAFNAQTDGIVVAAVLATACVFLVALVLYATRIIRPTRRLAFGVTAGIGGLALLYLMVWVISIFNWGFLFSDDLRSVGIAISVIAVVLAALSFTLDFGTIEAAVDANAPKLYEWYGAYALTVTLVWLYITLLRLLALLSRR